MDCFKGKQLIGDKCEPFLPGSFYSMPVGYSLPFRLTPRDSNTMDIASFLQDELRRNTSLSSTVCTHSRNSPSLKSFYSQVDIDHAVYSTEIEHKLITFSTELYKSNQKHMHIDFDYRSIFFVDESLYNTSTCAVRSRPLVSKLLVCPHVIFYDTEYSLSVDTHGATLSNYKATFKFYEYHIDSQKNLRICIDDFNTINLKQEDSIDIAYYVIMITCTVVSVVCLLLTLLTYCLFATLRTLPGKNILNLVLSLLLYHVFYLVLMTYDGDNITACQLIGILVHYFLLSTFGCFTVCTMHLFNVLGRNKLVSAVEASHGKYLLPIYVLTVYGYSIVLVVINIITTYIISEGSSFGYGRNGRCFVSNQYSFVGTVIIPMILTFIINITLYSITVYRLKGKIRLNTAIAGIPKLNRNELQIFVKLFVTTGCSWILLLVNVFVDEMLIYVIIAGFNSLQGLYVFIAYILNKRIYNMYRSKFIALCGLTNRSRETTMSSLSRPTCASIETDRSIMEGKIQHENKL